jgi:hypothetical protein
MQNGIQNYWITPQMALRVCSYFKGDQQNKIYNFLIKYRVQAKLNAFAIMDPNLPTIIKNDRFEAVLARELCEKIGLDLTNWSRWVRTNILENPFAIEGEDWEYFDPMTSEKNVNGTFQGDNSIIPSGSQYFEGSEKSDKKGSLVMMTSEKSRGKYAQDFIFHWILPNGLP